MKIARKRWATLAFGVGLVGIFLCDWAILQQGLRQIERFFTQPKWPAQEAVDQLSAFFHVLFVIGFSFSCLVISWAFWLLFREVRRHDALETELREAQNRAETLAQSRGELLANVSHEIRSPLGAMLSFGDILSRSDLDAHQKEVLEGSKMAAESLVRLANDLLDLSKMGAGKLALEPRPFDLREDVLKSLERVFQQKADDKKIGFKIEIAPDTPEQLLADPVRLTQILTNLLENGVKFTHRGYVFLLIEGFRMLEKGQSELRFIVKDTGDGIPAERLGQVFERFEQASSASPTIGAGLGLAIVRDLVVVMGGSISVESHVGFGTTFSVRLPFRSGASALAALSEAEKDEVSDAARAAFSGKKILLAEDNLLNQKMAEKMLADWGASVETAATGTAAVQLLEAKPEAFDLVLMDVTMPEMDGWAATAHIRTELKNTVPIIALTGWAQVGEREKCFAIGMDGYVAKPLRASAILAEIMPFLQKNESKKALSFGKETQKVLHLQYLIDLSKGKKTFVREMLDMFGKQAKTELLALREAVEKRDFEKIRTAAHSLKSTSAYVGMTSDGLDVLDKMENLGDEKTGQTAPLRTTFSEVEKLMAQAQSEARSADF